MLRKCLDSGKLWGLPARVENLGPDFSSTSGGLNSSMTAQKWEFGTTGGRTYRLQRLEQLGRKGEERKEPYASAATVCVSIAHREIPVLNCSSSKSAHNLFSALVGRHNHLPCKHKRAL